MGICARSLTFIDSESGVGESRSSSVFIRCTYFTNNAPGESTNYFFSSSGHGSLVAWAVLFWPYMPPPPNCRRKTEFKNTEREIRKSLHYLSPKVMEFTDNKKMESIVRLYGLHGIKPKETKYIHRTYSRQEK